MEELNLTHMHISVIRDALETQIDNLEKRLQIEYVVKEQQRLENCLKLRREALSVILVILETRNRDPLNIHIKR